MAGRTAEMNQPPHRPASASTASQPKSVAVAKDSTVFIAEIGKIEAFRSNQKVFEQKPSFEPSAVAASGSLVAIGGEVRTISCLPKNVVLIFRFRTRKSDSMSGMVKF